MNSKRTSSNERPRSRSAWLLDPLTDERNIHEGGPTADASSNPYETSNVTATTTTPTTAPATVSIYNNAPAIPSVSVISGNKPDGGIVINTYSANSTRDINGNLIDRPLDDNNNHTQCSTVSRSNSQNNSENNNNNYSNKSFLNSDSNNHADTGNKSPETGSELSITIAAISQEISENNLYDPVKSFQYFDHNSRSTKLSKDFVQLSTTSPARLNSANSYTVQRQSVTFNHNSRSSRKNITKISPSPEPLLDRDSASSFATSTSTPTTSSAASSHQFEMRRLNNDNRISGQSATTQSSYTTTTNEMSRNTRTRRGVNRLRALFGRSRNRNAVESIPEPRRLLMLTEHQHFLHNGIATAKYTVFTFLPKFLFEQFRRYSNIFFLFIGLMQQIPNVSPTGRFTTIVPLIVIMIISALKEIFEDWKRHAADKLVNNAEVKVLNTAGTQWKWVTKPWYAVSVGDLVLVEKNHFFPSDLILLSSKEPNGLCYIETSNLDGETNLKARTAVLEIDEAVTVVTNEKKVLDLQKLSRSNLKGCVIECDAPNKMLYEFTGKLVYHGKELPIGPNNILLRGAQMRNTDWAVGVVINTGHETKLMMNSMSQAPLKQSHVEVITNQQILALLGILIVICLISASFSIIWVSGNHDHWYVAELGTGASANFFLILLTFIILYNNLIPISLQVTLEMVRVIQAHFIDCDLQMYCWETKTFAQARTSNLNEELGQVRYILSDKTGTLTRNIMEFKKCSIAGVIYDEKKFYRLIEIIRKRENDWEKIREFLVLLAVCHTVIPEPIQGSDKLQKRFKYTASSPDEAALVKGAQNIGFEFLQRTPQQVLIDAMGSNEKYEILHVLEFNSDRKRMSVIVRDPAGKLKLYIKGADSMIEKRLSKDEKERFDKTEVNLTTFAKDGLRTLCCACATLSEERYDNWRKRYEKALLMQNKDVDARGKSREKCLDELMEEIETDLTLLGATAIEDKLQVGVPDTIEKLMRAGISIWMLTGDKQETATNIAYSCRLLRDAQNTDSYHIINERTLDATREAIIQAEVKLQNFPDGFTLIIDNNSLNFALTPELVLAFMDMALRCRSVVCCRVSPAQKADIVNAVKRSTKCITLAIGDGANDVAMIKAANVGVGISGREGLQAVYSSDYSIAQFRFLARLLLVHGSWSLSRVVKLILYSFYKNICLYVIELWFASVSAWSGQAVFERWSLSFYNVIFTASPPLVIGLFDRHCSAQAVLQNPELYSEQWGKFSVKQFWMWIASAIWHSLTLFWLSYFTLNHDTLWPHGRADGGYLCFGNILYTYVVVTVSLKAALELNCWTFWTHIAIWGSIGSWFVFITLYSRAWPTLPIGADIAGMDSIIFSSWMFWLGLVAIPFSALFFDFIYKVTQRTLHKSLADRIMELEAAQKLHANPDQTVLERIRQMVLQSIGSIFGSRTNINTTPSPSPDVNLEHSMDSSIDAALKRSEFARKRFASTDAEIDAAHGYSFSQEENAPDSELSQARVIRMYSTKI